MRRRTEEMVIERLVATLDRKQYEAVSRMIRAEKFASYCSGLRAALDELNKERSWQESVEAIERLILGAEKGN